MKSRSHKFRFSVALLALPLACCAAPSKATNTAPSENNKSAFTMPKTPADGHDPFFPKATSLYQIDTPRATPTPELGINLLKVNGLMGTSLAQINNVTFSIGETEEVKTASGNVSVRLVEIRAADGAVVIEANGQRRVLKFNAK